MNARKKTSAALIAFAMSASAFAGSDLDTRVHELERKVDTMSVTTAAGTFGPKTALSRAEPNGKGWFLSLDVLYWQSKVEGAQYALSVPSYTNAVQANVTSREPKFDWSFAFKAGIGYNFFYDGWDSHAEYTYFRNHAHDSSGVSAPSAIFPSNPNTLNITAPDLVGLVAGNTSEFATNSSGNLKLRLDDVILDLGRAFFVSKDLSFRPSIGLKASWITLKQSSRFSGGGTAFVASVNGVSTTFSGLGNNTIYSYQHQTMSGLGPRAGLDSKWYLGNDISVYGDITGALLFGYFKNESSITYSAIPGNKLAFKGNWHRLVPTVDFELGLIYDSYIMCDTQHFSVSLGYETQYYWQASYLGMDTVGLGGVGMYGVNLKFRWDF